MTGENGTAEINLDLTPRDAFGGLYPHVLQTVFGSAWAIREETFAIISDVVTARSNGQRMSLEEIDARVAAAQQRQGPRHGPRNGLVAVVPVYGTIMPRASLMSRMSGGTSVEEITAAVRAAQADPEVNSIILDIDSPGGLVDGVPELAAELIATRQSAQGGGKPIVAVANTLAASAAFWLGSAADEFIASPSAQVGSVGVFIPHQDQSKAAETQGVKTTLISAGKYKTEGNQFEPLSDEARASIQATVDGYYSMMIGSIAKGRGVSPDTVRNGYGEGRTLLAKPALAAGMIDRIDTLDNTIRRLARGGAVRAKDQQSTDNVEATGTGREAFADRLGLAAEEVAVVARHARERAAMRAAEGRKLSAQDIDGLRSLASTREALDEIDRLVAEQTAEPEASAADPVAAPKGNRRIVLDAMAEAVKRGYHIPRQ